jgi:hypothetical protein
LAADTISAWLRSRTGDAVDEVLVSNGSTDPATFRLAVLYDSTPHETL